jgi:hypothetical protein
MDKLKTNFDGGYPIYLDDYRYFDAAYRHGFESIVKATLGNDSACSLFGCTVTDSPASFSVSAGAIAFNGEILQVDAHSCVKATGVYVWLVFTEDDPDGEKELEGGTVIQAYEKRRAKMLDVSNVPEGTASESTFFLNYSLYDIYRKNLHLVKKSGWKKATLSDGINHFDDSPVTYCKNAVNQLEIRGSFGVASISNRLIMTLPFGYRPSKQISSFIVDTADVLPMYVDTIGQVHLSSLHQWSNSITHKIINITFSLDSSDFIAPEDPAFGGGQTT